MRRPLTALLAALTVSASAPSIGAQTPRAATPAPASAANPRNTAPQITMEALAGAPALQRRGEVYNGTAPRDWSVPLRTVRGRCYEIIAVATGASRVTAEVRANRARITEPSSLATSNHSVIRTRFCASLPGQAYSFAVHSEGPSTWAMAMRAAPTEQVAAVPPAAASNTAATAGTGDATASGASQTVTARGDASVAAATTTPAPDAGPGFPVGGTENDYVGTQIRNFAASRPGSRPVSAATRVNLATNQTHEFSIPLTAGHCVEVVAVGNPSVSDVDMEIFDPAGHRVAQDTQHRANESVRYCPAYSGSYRFTVRMFVGFGQTGIQAFEVR